MSAAAAAKRAGLNSVKQASDICNRPVRTLNSWFNDNRQLFNVLMDGCAMNKPATPSDKTGNRWFFVKIEGFKSEGVRHLPMVLSVSAVTMPEAIRKTPSIYHNHIVRIDSLAPGEDCNALMR